MSNVPGANPDDAADDDDGADDGVDNGAVGTPGPGGAPAINPILVERAAASARAEIRLDAELARIARQEPVLARRLFVAIMLPPAAVTAVAALADGLARKAQAAGVPIRWLPSADYHLTLRYLGPTSIDAEPSVRQAIERALASVALTSLTLRIGGLGAFASPDRARVIWAGLAMGGDGIDAIAAVLNRELDDLGFTPPAQPFTAHVTLGRLAQDRSIADLLATPSAQVFSEFAVDAVELVESLVKSNASNYKILRRIPFKTAEKGFQRQTSGLEPAQHTAATGRLAAPDTDDGWPRGQGPGDLE